tara:strand:- start:556 stop:876 length:321 start_codon:yes stop_codon:yes gene_type:complete
MVDVDMVSVVYATPSNQWIVNVPFSENMTALDAVKLSKLPSKHSEIEYHSLVLGLFGKEITHDYVLQLGDRIEICRPLISDPREMRRQFIALGKVMGQQDNDLKKS